MTTIYNLSQPCLAGSVYSFPAYVFSQSDTKLIKTSPTLAIGDVKVSLDGGGFNNITNLPVQVGTSGELTVSLTIPETTGATKYISVKFSDVAGAEWCDVSYIIPVFSSAAFTVPTSGDNADAVWDEVLNASTHNVPSSAGRRLRNVASTIVIDGTAVGAGINGNQIILDTGASSIDGAYDPALIAIVNGTGAGQCRLILDYKGSTKTATVDRTWKVNPTSSSEYIIYADPGREHVNEGLAQGGTTNTITLNSSASAINNEYVGQTVFIRSGLGEDQACKVISYNGTTKVATIGKNWGVIPNSTSAYVMLPTGVLDTPTLVSNTASAVWNASTRTLTSGGGGITPQDIWVYSTRTLTSGGNGSTAKEVWEYENRTLTSWRQLVIDIWNAIPNWISNKIVLLSQSETLDIYRGITNTITFEGLDGISGASNIIFSVKNTASNSDNDSLIRIELLSGLTVLNAEPFAQPAIGGNISIIDEDTSKVVVTLEFDPSSKLIPSQSRFYDIKARLGNEVKLISSGKINILPDITNQI